MLFRSNPCLPTGFGDFKLVRNYRSANYNIEVLNPDNVEKGIKSMIVDGVAVDGNIIPYDPSKTEVNVVITMG